MDRIVFLAFLRIVSTALPPLCQTTNSCRCDKTTHRATCQYVSRHIPSLPSYVVDIRIYGGYFPTLTKKTFSSISSHPIMNLEIANANIIQVESDALEDLFNLTSLHLSDNKNDSNWWNFEPSLTNMKPRFQSIFNGLEKLSHLILTKSDILKCYESFKQLKSLLKLDLSVNEISTCNTYFLPKALKELHLKSNHLTIIPEFCSSNGFSNTPSLEILNLDNNLINRIKNESIYCLNSLRTMSLGNNSFITFSTNFLPQNLKNLILGSNKLSAVPDFCSSNRSSNCPYMQTLNLENNELSRLTNRSFDCLPSLNTLSMRMNTLTDIQSYTFRSLSRLINLDLSNLKQFNTILNSNALYNPSLKYLNFSSNEVLPNISNLTNIEEYDLSNCIHPWMLNVNFVERAFGRLPHLKILNLTNCQWIRIPNGFFKLFPNVEQIYLSKNFIKDLIASLFIDNLKLKVLFLNGNRITYIGPHTFPLAFWKRIQVLDLSGNPFKCDCSLLWLRDKLNSSTKIIGKYLNKPTVYFDFFNTYRLYQCYSPPERVGIQLRNFNLTADDCKSKEAKSEIFTAVLVSSLSIVTIVIMSIIVTYKGRWHIRYWIYLIRYKHREYTLYEDVDYVYNAFVIYTDEDRNFVHNILLPKLEDKEEFRLCVHFRDFQPGKIISDNIVECMGNSRMAIVILSRYFCESMWCKFELTIAQDRWLNNESDALLLVMLEEIKSEHMTTELRALIRTTTYVTWTDNDQGQRLFWDKIMNTLRRQ